MSEELWKYSDLNMAVMLVAVPVIVLISVAVVNFLKERNERKMRSEQSDLPPNDYGSLNTHRISTNMRIGNENSNTNTDTTPPISQPIQSDHQMIFGSTTSEPITSIYSRSTDVPITTVIQEMEGQRRLADLQNEFERRAQERREILTNSGALHIPLPLVNFSLPDHTRYVRQIFPNSPQSPETHLFDRHPLPPYISQDDSLPSYEQAVLDERRE